MGLSCFSNNACKSPRLATINFIIISALSTLPMHLGLPCLFRNLHLHLHTRHPLPRHGSLSLLLLLQHHSSRRLIHYHCKDNSLQHNNISRDILRLSILSKTKQLYRSTKASWGEVCNIRRSTFSCVLVGLDLIPSRRSVNEFSSSTML